MDEEREEICGNKDNILLILQEKLNRKENKWQGPALGDRSGVRKNITHRKQTEKQKLKMATMAPK